MNEELQMQQGNDTESQQGVSVEYQAPVLESLGSWNELTRMLPGTGFGGGQGG